MRFRLLSMLLLIMATSARPAPRQIWVGTLTPTLGCLGHATGRIDSGSSSDTRVVMSATGLKRYGVYSVYYGETPDSLVLIADPDTVQANGRGELQMQRLLTTVPATAQVRLVVKTHAAFSVPSTVLEGILYRLDVKPGGPSDSPLCR